MNHRAGRRVRPAHNQKENMPNKSFKELVKNEHPVIVEALQAGGHVAGCDEQNAEPIDWIRILMETQADIALECRFDLSDPETNNALRRRLANLVAICEAWEKQITN